MGRMEDAVFFKEFIRMADDAWHMGWHESNGGNLSYRIREDEIRSVEDSFDPDDWKDIGTGLKGLAGEYFLVTGSGKHFRNISHDPADSLGVIEIDETGERYRQVWGYKNGGRPTSELYSHLMNHEVRKNIDEKCRVVYHNHPSNVIALSHILPLDPVVFTKELWGIMTEVPIVIPKGIGVLPWIVPGSRELGEATVKQIEKFDAVIWAYHGMFIAGRDFDQAFGTAHAVEKAAGILMAQISSGSKKLGGITKDQFKQLDRAYDLGMAEEYM